MNINVLMIDDDPKNTDFINKLLNGTKIKNYTIILKTCNDFDAGQTMLADADFDILILDIFKGKANEENHARDGEKILAGIRKTTFLPVIFFSGLTKYVEELKSDIIRVVTKTAGGNDELLKEIEFLLDSGIPLIRKRLNDHVKECMREYLWEFVQEEWKSLSTIKDEFSIGYLLARRIAKSFSKSNVQTILGDHKISKEKIYPMEFYIYPIHDESIEAGDVLRKEGVYYVVVTPSCDIAQEKTTFLHLAKCIPFEESREYQEFSAEKKRTPQNANKFTSAKDKLSQLIRSGRRDCHFFIPKTSFIENLVVDFEQLTTINLKDANTFERIAKLDAPFAQSMIIKFIRHFNRIGTEDLDADYIINKIS